MATLPQSAKTSKSKKTKRRIVNAYFELMYGKEWDKITVKEICARAEITRGTFYQYYNDIYDVIDQEEKALLDDITARYNKLPFLPRIDPPKDFDAEFSYAPPPRLVAWFDFCKDHRKAMAALLDKQYGDHYFVKRLKDMLKENIIYLMERDGQPNDELRDYFVNIFLELHFMSALIWLERGEEEFLSITQIVTLLNTMRVGANYLSYAKRQKIGFAIKDAIPEYTGEPG